MKNQKSVMNGVNSLEQGIFLMALGLVASWEAVRRDSVPWFHGSEFVSLVSSFIYFMHFTILVV